MDCKTARLLIDFASPARAELEPADAEALDNHLFECPACAQLSRDERRQDEHIGAALRDVPLPANLRERLLGRLAQDEQLRLRRRRVRIAWSLAAAAVLLLAVGIGWHLTTRPGALDLVNIQEEAWGQFNPGRTKVDKWLLAQNSPVPSPPSFDYNLLTYYQTTQLQNRSVPMLLFTRKRDQGPVVQARVYLISARQFDLDAMQSDAQGFGSGCKIEVLRHPTDRRFAYLVVHNAEKLELFLKPDDFELTSSQS